MNKKQISLSIYPKTWDIAQKTAKAKGMSASEYIGSLILSEESKEKPSLLLEAKRLINKLSELMD